MAAFVGAGAVYFSGVYKEIARARSPRREWLEQVVPGMRPNLLDMTPEVEMLAEQYLAEQYLAERIIPARFRDDLPHVAAAVCYRLDMIVSWNMKHLANPNKVALINAVNRRQGRPFMRIHTPKEMIGL